MDEGHKNIEVGLLNSDSNSNKYEDRATPL